MSENVKTQRPTVVTTGECLLSYVNIFEPRAFQEGGEPKYSVTLFIPKSDTATINRLKAAVQAAKNKGVQDKWGGNMPKIFEGSDFAGTTIRDVDKDRDQDGELLVAKHPYGKDCYMIHVSAKNKPGVVDQTMNEILDRTKVYSGCYGRANITFFPYNNAGKKGISAGLNHIQFLRDGDPLGSTVKIEDAFAD